jgi:hypothetical protein
MLGWYHERETAQDSRVSRDNILAALQVQKNITITVSRARAIACVSQLPTGTPTGKPINVHILRRLLPALLPVLFVALVVLARLLGTARRLAGHTGLGANHVIACLAISLRLLVVGFPGRRRLEMCRARFGPGRRVNGGGRFGGRWTVGLGCLAWAGYFIVRILVPTNFFLSGGGYVYRSVMAHSEDQAELIYP